MSSINMREVEYKRKIIDYVKKNLKKGYPLESLKWALVKQGYSRTLIDASIKDASSELSKEIPVLREEKPVITHEVVGANDQPTGKRSWWKKLFGID